MSLHYTLSNNDSVEHATLEICLIERYDTTVEAQARLSQILDFLQGEEAVSSEVLRRYLPKPTPAPETTPSARIPWTAEETAAIAGASSPKEAARLYRAVFPDSQRTDYAVIKRHDKIRRDNRVEPISTGEEVTLHEDHEIPEPEPTPTLEKPKRKDAWLPEEDDVLLEAPTAEVAEILHGKAFPGKRTKSAIQARWYKLNPFDTRLEKIHADTKPTLPERGSRVRTLIPLGRAPTGTEGKVLRRDEKIGEVLVDLGPQNGCQWLQPERVEVVA